MIRLLVVMAAAGLLGGKAMAQDADTAAAAILACDAIKKEKDRLECFERALPALRASHPSAAEVESARADDMRRAEEEREEDQFGLEESRETKFEDESTFGEEDLAKRTDEGAVKTLRSVAVEVGRNNAGKLFVILENGQIWKQVFDDGSSPYFKRDGKGLPVEIKRGVLGAYFVKIGDSKDTFRAQRIK